MMFANVLAVQRNKITLCGSRGLAEKRKVGLKKLERRWREKRTVAEGRHLIKRPEKRESSSRACCESETPPPGVIFLI